MPRNPSCSKTPSTAPAASSSSSSSTAPPRLHAHALGSPPCSLALACTAFAGDTLPLPDYVVAEPTFGPPLILRSDCYIKDVRFENGHLSVTLSHPFTAEPKEALPIESDAFVISERDGSLSPPLLALRDLFLQAKNTSGTVRIESSGYISYGGVLICFVSDAKITFNPLNLFRQYLRTHQPPAKLLPNFAFPIPNSALF